MGSASRGSGRRKKIPEPSRTIALSLGSSPGRDTRKTPLFSAPPLIGLETVISACGVGLVNTLMTRACTMIGTRSASSSRLAGCNGPTAERRVETDCPDDGAGVDVNSRKTCLAVVAEGCDAVACGSARPADCLHMQIAAHNTNPVKKRTLTGALIIKHLRELQPWL